MWPGMIVLGESLPWQVSGEKMKGMLSAAKRGKEQARVGARGFGESSEESKNPDPFSRSGFFKTSWSVPPHCE